MGRHHSISQLTDSLKEQVHSLIRRHGYAHLDMILADMRDHGIDGISRSALGRYVGRLKAHDEMNRPGEGQTIVLIVARDSGVVRMFSTAAPATMVLSHLAGMPPSEP